MCKLLVVDDEHLERQAIQFLVHTRCPEIKVVGEADNGETAVQAAVQQRPDMVVMDIRMPGMNGLEAMAVICRRLPDVKVIILTAFDEFDYAREAVKLGAVEYLLKPVRPDELVRVLNKVADQVREEKRRQAETIALRRQLEQAIPYIQMSLVYDLMTGSIVSADEVRERAALCGVRLDAVATMVLDIDHFARLTRHDSELDKQLLKQQVYHTVCQAIGSSGLVMPFSSDSLVVIISVDSSLNSDQMTKAVITAAEVIRDKVSSALGLTVTIGVGRCYQNLKDAGRSYTEALAAVRQGFFVGTNRVIHIERLPNHVAGSVVYPFHIEKTILDKVRCGERHAAKTAICRLLDEIVAGSNSMVSVQASVLELLVVLSRAAVEGGASIEQPILLNFDSINALEKCRSPEAVQRWLQEAVDQYFDNMLENRSTVNRRVINKACEYISQNYRHNLTLEEVAQTVHLSPYYFSRLFKQETGKNFVEYLTAIRLEKAKKMLRDTQFSITRVAMEVGYHDASYFSRVFRQETGMTPNQYRTNTGKGNILSSGGN